MTAPPDTGPGDGPADRSTTGELLREGTERLRASGSESARLDAELLLGHAVGVGRTTIVAHPEAAVGADAVRSYHVAIDRRAAGEPVAYIRGIKEFNGLAFFVDRRVLIPRPETERLVEIGLAEVMRRLGSRPGGGEPIAIADVGTGSGAIAVALAAGLRHRNALEAVTILATDRSPDAIEVAKDNAVGHAVADRISFAVADLLPDDVSAFDLILANLPYVRSDAMASLPIATTFEPRAALDGGAAGLGIIGRLLDRMPRALSPDGVGLLEIGADQGEAIVSLAAERLPGWSCTVASDLAGLPRVARLARG